MQASILRDEFHRQRISPGAGQDCTCPLCRGERAQKAQEAATEADYATRLVRVIGPANVDAIRALDAGADPRVVWLRWQEALLSPLLASVMTLARQQGAVTNEDLRGQDPVLSPSTISNRLAELERRGLLIRGKPQVVKGGGRRFAYLAWDYDQETERLT